jgi:hypothetical protein
MASSLLRGPEGLQGGGEGAPPARSLHSPGPSLTAPTYNDLDVGVPEYGLNGLAVDDGNRLVGGRHQRGDDVVDHGLEPGEWEGGIRNKPGHTITMDADVRLCKWEAEACERIEA